MGDLIQNALMRIFEEVLQCQPESNFRHEHDPAWPSPCEMGTPDANGLVSWRPVKRESVLDFSGLEHATGMEIHADMKSYYSAFFSDPVSLFSKEGQVNLLQLWNERDFDRLVENLLGHFLAKQRLRHPFTIFFATIEENTELFLSLDNQTGRVLLEEPGMAPIREVAPDLLSFLNRLTPEP
ncbi:MAG: SecY-interacting protein Syd [Gammaproteobacteria bacterium]|nr:SecY-interacting protein Syd [Gammaproteobacteria bacterium]